MNLLSPQEAASNGWLETVKHKIVDAEIISPQIALASIQWKDKYRRKYLEYLARDEETRNLEPLRNTPWKCLPPPLWLKRKRRTKGETAKEKILQRYTSFIVASLTFFDDFPGPPKWSRTSTQ